MKKPDPTTLPGLDLFGAPAKGTRKPQKAPAIALPKPNPEQCRELEAMQRARKAARNDRRKRVLELRNSGYSIVQVANQLGVTRDTVINDEGIMLAELADENRKLSAHHRTKELARLDEIGRRLFEQSTDPNYARNAEAASAYLKISERRAKLLGLDAPKRMQISDADVTEVVNCLLPIFLKRLSSLPQVELDLMVAEVDEQIQRRFGQPDDVKTTLGSPK